MSALNNQMGQQIRWPSGLIKSVAQFHSLNVIGKRAYEGQLLPAVPWNTSHWNTAHLLGGQFWMQSLAFIFRVKGKVHREMCFYSYLPMPAEKLYIIIMWSGTGKSFYRYNDLESDLEMLYKLILKYYYYYK